MLIRIVSVALLLLAATQLAPAHDTYIGTNNGELLVLHGHGTITEPYDPAKVSEPIAFDAKGQAVPIGIVKNKENASLVPKGKPAIVGALWYSGYWLKTTDGWKEGTKREGAGKYDILQSFKSEHWCKRFLAPSSKSCKPLGQRFEIVPEKNPMTLSAGDKLPIQVLLNGKPVQGALIIPREGHGSKKKETIRTDKEGKATVLIEKSGPQLIKARYRVPFEGDPDADMLSYSSTITFNTR